MKGFIRHNSKNTEVIHMSSQSNTLPVAKRRSFGGIFKAALIGASGAAAVNLILLALAGLLGIPLNVMTGPPPNSPVTAIDPAQVIFFSVAPAFVGALLYFGLTRVSVRANAIFIGVAVVVLLLSFLGPLTADGAVVLILMHIAAATVITWALITRS
jgi:hypothetical protein